MAADLTINALTGSQSVPPLTRTALEPDFAVPFGDSYDIVQTRPPSGGGGSNRPSTGFLYPR